MAKVENWQIGRKMEYPYEEAHAERQIAWVDTSSRPPSTVVLKLQQDLASRDYLLKVNLETLR